MKRRSLALLLLAASCACAAETLRVMTFNVRLPTPSDGPNRWELRRDLLVDTIRLKDPDIFGTQELFQIQGQYIAEKLPAYAWFGISRRGNHEDEHMGVFYKPAKLRPIETGNFWLSETPETPGSMSWDVTLPRMVTWGLFEIKATGRRFYYYNTHFPHRREDAEARLRCARLIAARIARLPQDVPFVMTGDFNSPAAGDVYRVFESTLQEAWATAPRKSGPPGTSSRFTGGPGGARIDWILFRGGLKALAAETVSHNHNGRYPSDHYPVFALLELP